MFILTLALYKLNKWEPEEDLSKVIKAASMIAVGAYMVHLAMDSTTPKSLPIL